MEKKVQNKLNFLILLVLPFLVFVSCIHEEEFNSSNFKASIKAMELCNEEMKQSISCLLKEQDENNPLLSSQFLSINNARSVIDENFLDDESEEKIILSLLE